MSTSKMNVDLHALGQLRESIKSYRAAGWGNSRIRKTLSRQGYAVRDIRQSLDELAGRRVSAI